MGDRTAPGLAFLAAGQLLTAVGHFLIVTGLQRRQAVGGRRGRVVTALARLQLPVGDGVHRADGQFGNVRLQVKVSGMVRIIGY